MNELLLAAHATVNATIAEFLHGQPDADIAHEHILPASCGEAMNDSDEVQHKECSSGGAESNDDQPPSGQSPTVLAHLACARAALVDLQQQRVADKAILEQIYNDRSVDSVRLHEASSPHLGLSSCTAHIALQSLCSPTLSMSS